MEQAIPRGGALCLQRLSDLLNFDLRKTNLAVGLRRKNETAPKGAASYDRATICLMQKAIQESGDCAFERDIVREALKMAASQDAEPSQLPSVDPVLLGCNAIIAIARTDGKEWQAKALSELELVRNLWANHRRDKPGRVARKKASRTARAVQKRMKPTSIRMRQTCGGSRERLSNPKRRLRRKLPLCPQLNRTPFDVAWYFDGVKRPS